MTNVILWDRRPPEPQLAASCTRTLMHLYPITAVLCYRLYAGSYSTPESVWLSADWALKLSRFQALPSSSRATRSGHAMYLYFVTLDEGLGMMSASRRMM